MVSPDLETCVFICSPDAMEVELVAKPPHPLPCRLNILQKNTEERKRLSVAADSVVVRGDRNERVDPISFAIFVSIAFCNIKAEEMVVNRICGYAFERF